MHSEQSASESGTKIQENEYFLQNTTGADDTTRYLCASALSQPWTYRATILNHVTNRHRAASPEIGLDVNLLAQVCKSVESEDQIYQFGFAFIGVLLVMGFFQGGFFAPLVVLSWIFACLVATTRSLARHNLAISLFSRNNYDPEKIKQRFKAKVEQLIPSPESLNPIIYSGFKPFVGAGTSLENWSFVIDISKPKGILGDYKKPKSFSEEDLNIMILTAIEDLKLSDTAIYERGYLNGEGLRQWSRILPDAFGIPNQNLTVEDMRSITSNPGNPMRRYIWVQIRDWNKEMTVSHILRFSLQNSKLFVENTQHILLPVKDIFRNVDRMQSLDLFQGIRYFLRSLAGAPVFAFLGILYVWDKLSKTVVAFFITEEKKIRRAIRGNPLYDYGVMTSVREMYSDARFIHYFQKLDYERYVKTLDQTILDTIADFLDVNDIDTTLFNGARNNIINNGVIMQGGVMNANALAVGVDAQVKTEGNWVAQVRARVAPKGE
jgi:hypothetical protein